MHAFGEINGVERAELDLELGRTHFMASPCSAAATNYVRSAASARSALRRSSTARSGRSPLRPQ